MRRRALVGLLGVVALAAAPASAAPIEVRAARGLDGVVAARGIDVAVVEVRSGADAALTGTVEIAGRSHAIALAARGLATVTVAARLPSGASALTALPVRVRVGSGDVAAEIPAGRVVARPLVMIGDPSAAALATIEPWRLDRGLGEVVALAPGRVPAAWPALQGVGALVLDRPATELPAATARAVRRFLAAGGEVCRLVDDRGPTCVQADVVSVPRTRERARLAGTMRTWALVALALAAALALATLVPRRRGPLVAALLALGALAPALPVVRGADSRLAARGVRADAGGGEDWVAAELGVSDLAGALDLGPDLWLEPTDAEGGGALDDVGLRGRVPAPGSWRLRGFVPATARGWAAHLTRHPRPLPELP